MTPQQLEVRKRLKDDFQFYAKHCLKIRTKAGAIEPLILNEAQQILDRAIEEELASKGFVRIIILKGRQQGLSTCVGAYLYHKVSQSKARKAMVVTHHADSTRALFDMTKRYHDNAPEIVKPSTRYASRRELNFNVLDSSYVVATAGGESIGRGETLSDAHISELGFWSPTEAKKNLNGLLQAIPDTPGTNIFIESTANGVTGMFYEYWQGAVAKNNGFRAVFIPWFLERGYRSPVDKPLEHSPDEKDLIVKYKLDDEQLMWRRLKIAKDGLDLFKQEYPCHPDEAFLTTGSPVFNTEALVKRLDEIGAARSFVEEFIDPQPLKIMGLLGDKFEEIERGNLKLWREVDPTETYYIGADIALGVRNGDYSVAQVLDSKKRQCATWRGHVEPDKFASVLNALGRMFNTALIAPENNNHGILTCSELTKHHQYPNVYMKTVVDTLTEKESIVIGFATNSKTKPLIIDELRAALRDGTIEINDPVTLREMLTYIVTESGSLEAEKGKHDDCVTSLAICNHINEGSFTPIQATDDWYIESI